MESKIQLIEKIRNEFDNGMRPKDVAKKYNQPTNRIGGLARLLGYDFGVAKRNPRDWAQIPTNKPRISFGLSELPELDKAKKYRVSDVNKATQKITIVWE